MSKILFVGMNNPQGNPPFFPDPPGSAGHRLYMMLKEKVPEVKELDYLLTFDRINLMEGRVFLLDVAKANSVGLWESWVGREVVLFGDQVCTALEVPRIPWISRRLYKGVRYRQLPHPSGLNRWYNDKMMRETVCLLLEEYYARTKV